MRVAKLSRIDFLRLGLSTFFCFAGVRHFLHPAPFVRAVPDYLPNALMLVYVSGFFEIAGGLGILIKKLRKTAASGLIALLVAIFPANIHMALHSDLFPEFPPTIFWLRLPLQFLFIYWVYYAAIYKSSR